MKLIVIGGGAAGVFAACNAARMHAGLEVVLLEQSANLLSKVKVSGGGRCNLTHYCNDIPEMIKCYPRGKNFLKKSFHNFFTQDTVEWFESRGVKLKTEADGRMFPVTDDSQTIISTLVNELNKYRVKLQFSTKVTEITKKEKWEVKCLNGATLQAAYVCIACGGLNKPSMFDFLKSTGHSIINPVPSLFTFNVYQHPLKELMGIAVENCSVSIPSIKMADEGPLLITHWGFSGPAVLKLSAFAARELKAVDYHFKIRINWLHTMKEPELRGLTDQKRITSSGAFIMNKQVGNLPQRLWKYLCKRAAIEDSTRWAALSAASRQKLMHHLLADEYEVRGKTTFKEEFVTAGGVKLSEVNPHTMESRLQKGLYFAGEILDVDGITGGYNFQHAWTSGYIASRLGS